MRQWGPVGLACLGLAGCLPPRALPLRGIPASPALIPRAVAALPPGHVRIRFRWRVRDPQFSVGGDGAARTAAPDSARLDFVVGGALGGSGHALLFDDTLVAPGSGGVRRYLPATPLLWASLGRLAVPAAADTVVRLQGDTVRADIGAPGVLHGVVWRIAIAGGQLTSLSRLQGGRVRETVVRELDRGRIRYDNPGAHRSLTLTQIRSEPVPEFDPAIWRR